ncbi:unnamed protein product [Urochloa humidicola]
MASAQLMVRDGDKRGKLHALAVTNDGVLPTDVLYEVLLHLPVDILCRFRLVCRSWRSLTSDPTFAKAHSFRHPIIVGVRSVSGTWSNHDCEFQFVDALSGNTVKRIRPCHNARQQ